MENLPYATKSLDDIDEAFRGFYTKNDVTGEFVFSKLTGMPKAPNEKEIANLRAEAEKAKALHGKFGSITDEDLEILKKARANKLIDEGKLLEYADQRAKEAVEQYTTKLAAQEKQTEELNEKIRNYESKIKSRAQADAFAERLSELKFTARNSLAQKAIFQELGKCWSIDDHGKLSGKNPDGTPLLSAEKPGERMTIDEAIRGFVQENPFMFVGSDGKGMDLNSPTAARGYDLSDPVALGRYALSLGQKQG